MSAIGAACCALATLAACGTNDRQQVRDTLARFGHAVRTHAGHRLKPGRYVAILRATDASNNDSPPVRLRFRVR